VLSQWPKPNQILNSQVFDSFLAIVDDALALAKEAVDSAEQAATPAPKVMLTKVASETYEKAAKALVTTGIFPGKSAEEITTTLRQGSESDHISIMEKLASSAIFPVSDENVFDGDLVEKSASGKAYQHLDNKTAVWQQAMDEAEDELG
jgi:hypothetical protein